MAVGAAMAPDIHRGLIRAAAGPIHEHGAGYRELKDVLRWARHTANQAGRTEVCPEDINAALVLMRAAPPPRDCGAGRACAGAAQTACSAAAAGRAAGSL